jgi:hypothetical protein
MSFDISKVRATLGALEANAHTDDIVLATIVPADDGSGFSSCAGVVDYLRTGGSGITALGCVMTGVAEGDCQKMTTFASDIDMAAFNAMAAQEAEAWAAEAARLKAEAQPLARAAAALHDRSDTALLDLIVFADSQYWSYNRYVAGSMHDVKVESANEGIRVLRGEYLFNGTQQGWVRVTLYPGWTRLPCVEFWDFAGACRPTRVAANFVAPAPPPPPPPAPEAVPAAAPSADPAAEPAPPSPEAPGEDSGQAAH